MSLPDTVSSLSIHYLAATEATEVTLFPQERNHLLPLSGSRRKVAIGQNTRSWPSATTDSLRRISIRVAPTVARSMGFDAENCLYLFALTLPLRGVSFTIDEGAVVTLLGSNGAGKSTTLRAISGLVAPRAGSIRFDGKPIAGLSPRAIVKLGVAHVPEGRRVFPGLTVRENIMLGTSNGNASASAIRREADAMFDVFPDIKRSADTLGWKLSGGQRDAPSRQYLLDHAKAQWEPEIQPDRVTDKLSGVAVASKKRVSGRRHPGQIPDHSGACQPRCAPT